MGLFKFKDIVVHLTKMLCFKLFWMSKWHHPYKSHSVDRYVCSLCLCPYTYLEFSSSLYTLAEELTEVTLMLDYGLH